MRSFHIRGALCCPLAITCRAESSKFTAIHIVALFDLQSLYTGDESRNDHVGSGLQLIPNRGVSLPIKLICVPSLLSLSAFLSFVSHLSRPPTVTQLCFHLTERPRRPCQGPVMVNSLTGVRSEWDGGDSLQRAGSH